MRLLIGNRRYSSWSLRGWLACKLAGLPFRTELLPLDSVAFADAVARGLLPSARVPVLMWPDPSPAPGNGAGESRASTGPITIWETVAIVHWLAERAPGFWPEALAARALAMSMAAAMHGGFPALRAACPMDLRRTRAPDDPGPDALADLARIDALWTAARAHATAGPYLFGPFSAADAMYAPIAHRALAYALPLGPVAAAYARAVMDHPWIHEWTAAIGDEPPIAEHRL